MLIINNKLIIVLIFTNIITLYYLFKIKKQYLTSQNKHSAISEYLSNIITTVDSIRYGNLIARLEKNQNKKSE